MTLVADPGHSAVTPASPVGKAGAPALHLDTAEGAARHVDAAVVVPPGLPRLLPVHGREDLETHLERVGPVPGPAAGSGSRRASALVQLLGEAGLVGRGGAAFPTACKLETVARSGRNPVVVVNAVEGEPASGKDRVLLSLAPHLVLDGAEVVARALGASRVVVCLADDDRAATAVPWSSAQAARSLEAARAERAADLLEIEIRRLPHRFVSGESSSVVRWLDGGPALPLERRVPLARRGVGGRPTVLDNAETFAHIALIARFGPSWYRSVGHVEDPGSALVTIAGTAPSPTVAEIALGSPLGALLESVAGRGLRAGAVLLGGYGGSWVGAAAVPSVALLLQRSLTPTPMGGVVCVLPESACGLAETARLVHFLARESAGQCGPCVNGLPALAGAFDEVARPRSAALAARAAAQLERWCGQIDGRGACRHPDGAVRLVRSALEAFADDVSRHVRGQPCDRVDHPAVLPVPEPSP